jgi:hypothetical protein
MHYLWIFAALLVNQMHIHVSLVILYLLKHCKEMQTLMIMRWHMAMHGRGNEGQTEWSGYLVSRDRGTQPVQHGTNTTS